MKVVNYKMEVFNSKGKIITEYYVPTLIMNSIDREMLIRRDEIEPSRMLYYKHKEKDQYTKFVYLDELKHYIKKFGFDVSTHYVFDSNNNQFIQKDVVFYGGRGGEFYILADDEEYEFLTSKGEYWILDEITVIKNNGVYDIKGEYVFSDSATIHGYWKIHYNQEILITKKISDELKNRYKLRVFRDDVIVIDDIDNRVIFSLNNYNYHLIDFRTEEIRYKDTKFKDGFMYIKLYIHDLKNKDGKNPYIVYKTKLDVNTYDEYVFVKYINQFKSDGLKILVRYNDIEDFVEKRVKIANL